MLQVLMAVAPKLKNCRVRWFTDNQNVARILQVGSKKSSGTSYRDAIHGHYFFEDQSMVDEFVTSAPSTKRKSVKVCFIFEIDI